MKILITGAGGFLGKGILAAFKTSTHHLRLMDIVPITSNHELFLGSVANYNLVREAVAGMEAIIIAHMGGHQTPEGGYSTPCSGFDINVKGTANLFHAAQEEGIKKVILISSLAAVGQPKGGVDHNTPPGNTNGMYGLTKALQEHIALHYHKVYDIKVACLRVGLILDAQDGNKSKYGEYVKNVCNIATDRTDIGQVALKCIEKNCIDYEVFNVIGTDFSIQNFDVKYTRDKLDWVPKYDFSDLEELNPVK